MAPLNAPEASEEPTIEVYVRMNDDQEKDYSFGVSLKDDFQSLLRVFDVLKISLRPSVFYHHKPIGFQVSTHPGLLTYHGGLLFADDAAKQVKDVKLTDKIGDQVWAGQLLLPVWKHDNATFYTFIIVLAAWLYTDMPDVYSPTPGICLTNQVSKLLYYILLHFGQNKLALDILSETVPNKSSYMAQMVFFTFHVLKVLMVFLSFWSGLFNPYTLNPYKTYQINKTDKLDESKKEQLMAIGWRGSRRGVLDEYRDFIKDVEVKKYGSILNASKNGLFDKIRKPVITLGKGEGFDTPLDSKRQLDDLVKDPSKFTISYEYYEELLVWFTEHMHANPDTVSQDIKNFRKFGPSGYTDRLKVIVEKRRELDAEQEKKSAEAKKKD